MREKVGTDKDGQAVYDPRPFTKLGPRMKNVAANALRCLLAPDDSTEYWMCEASKMPPDVRVAFSENWHRNFLRT
jgi:hypothetical protein